MSAPAPDTPVIVTVAAPSAAAAEAMAARLLAERLVACAQIHPVTSTFRWHGAVERAEEAILTLKTVHGRYREIETAVRRMHDYEVPEILCLPVVTGYGPYLAWLRAEAGPDQAD